MCIRVGRGVGEGFRTRFGDEDLTRRLREDEAFEREELDERDGERDLE